MYNIYITDGGASTWISYLLQKAVKQESLYSCIEIWDFQLEPGAREGKCPAVQLLRAGRSVGHLMEDICCFCLSGIDECLLSSQVRHG